MSSNDEHTIRDEERLREVIGAGMPGIEIKNRKALDEYSRGFVELAPLIVLSTSDVDGNLVILPATQSEGLYGADLATHHDHVVAFFRERLYGGAQNGSLNGDRSVR